MKDFTAEAMETLSHHSWPGNVRELRFAVERAVVMCRGDRITVRDLPQSARGDEPAGGGAARAPRQRAV